ncbi:DUF2293 domain-containing protein [Horticoccus sp. 23ND18S-11]|uniref:DUF2293 domain-containing protein n=1 Tax=Horticoccus sp. 23ND18S-11 TaxID=3391832 RepID=UPI0039C98401
MSSLAREVRPSQNPGHVINEHAVLEAVPAHWSLLPPGDAALSRRIKLDGPSWTMVEIVGRKRFSRGIWAPTVRIEALRAALLAERRDPAYQRQLDAGRARRARAESDYSVEFRAAVLAFLAFHPRYATDAARLATLIADHATPVGSGTVARTERIPVEARAEAATIAWLRHQTTGYDTMRIPLIKGKRREVRRLLAQRSHQLLALYRQGRDLADSCPLQAALRRAEPALAPGPAAATPVQSTLF